MAERDDTVQVMDARAAGTAHTSTPASDPAPAQISYRRIAGTWWPLAASWVLMGLEMPVVSAVLARLPAPEINLAAYGGIVFPLALLVEAPVIMLLAASTALSKDWPSYRKVRRFMMLASGGMTVVHLLVTFTPLYYLVVRGIIGVPEEIVEPGRVGLMIMTPWTWAIGYRRFQQGVLIRFGYSRAVGIGTLVRLLCNCLVLTIGFFFTDWPGIVVGASGIATGVICEAIYAGLRVRPVIRDKLRPAPLVDEPLTGRSFLSFYVPLALTSTVGLLWLPLNSFAMSRMPAALESLAVWPVIAGMVFIFRALGIAYNEVVVALIDRPRSVRRLRKYTRLLSMTNTALLVVIAGTPISYLWFGKMSALSPELVALARSAIWISTLVPFISMWQSWFQGVIVNGRRTRGIPEAVAIGIGTAVCVLAGGIIYGRVTGLYVALFAGVVGQSAQLLWVRHRSRWAMRQVEARDRHYTDTLTAGPESPLTTPTS